MPSTPTGFHQPVSGPNLLRIFQEVPLLLMARNSVIVAVLGVLAVVLSSSIDRLRPGAAGFLATTFWCS